MLAAIGRRGERARKLVAQLREEFNSLKEDIALLRTELKNIVKPS